EPGTHRYGWPNGNARSKVCNGQNSYSHGSGFRTGPVGSCSQPFATRWKHHGLVGCSPEIAGKRLELLKEISPNVSHVTVLGNSNVPGNAEGLRELQAAAAAMRLQLKYTEVPTLRDMEIAFQDAAKEYMQAVIVLPNPVAISQRKQVV